MDQFKPGNMYRISCYNREITPGEPHSITHPDIYTGKYIGYWDRSHFNFKFDVKESNRYLEISRVEIEPRAIGPFIVEIKELVLKFQMDMEKLAFSKIQEKIGIGGPFNWQGFDANVVKPISMVGWFKDVYK